VVFQEEENAHTEEQMEAIEFPDNANELHDEIQETIAINDIQDSLSRVNSKSRNPFTLSYSELALE
jgi:hypothetical protein